MERMYFVINNTTEPSYDQKYGQSVIGGMGEDSKTTSEFTGPSIDGSPKYIDQYKTIKGWIDKFFGRKYNVEKHNVEPKEPRVYHYREYGIKLKETGKKDGVFRNYRKDTIFIIDIKSREGKIISKDTIWGKEQK